jgi:hypothetical protein
VALLGKGVYVTRPSGRLTGGEAVPIQPALFLELGSPCPFVGCTTFVSSQEPRISCAYVGLPIWRQPQVARMLDAATFEVPYVMRQLRRKVAKRHSAPDQRFT